MWGDLSVAAALNVGTNLVVGGNAAIDGNLTVGGDITFDGDLTVEKDLRVNGHTYLQNTSAGPITADSVLTPGNLQGANVYAAVSLTTENGMVSRGSIKIGPDAADGSSFIGNGSGLTNLPPVTIAQPYASVVNGITDYGVSPNQFFPEDPAQAEPYVYTAVNFKTLNGGNPAPPGVYVLTTRLSNLLLTYLEVSNSITVTWNGSKLYGFSQYERFQIAVDEVELWFSPQYSQITWNSGSDPAVEDYDATVYCTYGATLPIPATIVNLVTGLNIDVYQIAKF